MIAGLAETFQRLTVDPMEHEDGTMTCIVHVDPDCGLTPGHDETIEAIALGWLLARSPLDDDQRVARVRVVQNVWAWRRKAADVMGLGYAWLIWDAEPFSRGAFAGYLVSLDVDVTTVEPDNAFELPPRERCRHCGLRSALLAYCLLAHGHAPPCLPGLEHVSDQEPSDQDEGAHP